MLYKHYSSALLGIIVRIVDSDKLGEEILQQTFLKIWDKIETYDESKSRLFTWMAIIARNTAIDAVRLTKYKNIQKTDSIDINEHDVRSTNSNPADKMDVDELTYGLDQKYKVVIRKIYLEGYTHAELSLLLNIPIGTIKTRLRKGLQILRASLKNEQDLFLGSFLFPIIIGLLCL